MGRRSINTTKSGKYMNPTDQARKEARKRELKKNKKQRMMVRMAVLKGKDPLKLIEEMDVIDEMEYDPNQPPKLSERVLKDKRKKLQETFDRVFSMYEKEDPEYAIELRKKKREYEKRKGDKQSYFGQVKNAERVQLDEIPLPDMPSAQPVPSQIPLPSDIPLPIPGPNLDEDLQPKSILKKTSLYDSRPQEAVQDFYTMYRPKKRKPPGPPPGTPPSLSDTDGEDEPAEAKKIYDRVPPPPESQVAPPPPGLEEIDMPPPAKQRKIRFEDDSDSKSGDEEKEPHNKYLTKPAPVSALQLKMLRMAGQQLPSDGAKEGASAEKDKESVRESERSRDRDRDKEREREREERRRKRRKEEEREDSEMRRRRRMDSDSSSDEDVPEKKEAADSKPEADKPVTVTPGVPPGPPPGLPPGPPPGMPPMMFRPPPIRGPPGALPRMLPPGPPPGRPPGLPPGPPPGLPPTMRGMPPRLPPGPPGAPPPRMIRPPGAPPGVPPTGVAAPAGKNPNILSAPPSILKPQTRDGKEERQNTATIEAKPQIKHTIGDVTRFMPTALKVKRELKDAKGRIIRSSGGMEEKISVQSQPKAPAQTKDDAYDTFMREMEGLI